MIRIFFICVFCFLSAQSFAQTAPTSETPLEISADQALEWDRTNTRYFARKNAVAKQGDFEVRGDVLTADYRDEKGQNKIYRVTAEGNVKLLSGDSIGTGQKAIYTVEDGKAILTGGDLKLTGQNMVITCNDRFEFYQPEGKLIAIGSPIITSGEDKLTADRVTAFLATDDKGKRVLDRAEALGNVTITNQKEKATSNRGIYNARQRTVELLDNVVLTQGQNILTGARATMDLTTKLSRMYGADNGKQRVKAVFYTGKESPLPSPSPSVKSSVSKQTP